MTDERIRDMLPDQVAGRLDAERARRVEEAVAGDEELAAEAALLEAVLAARAEPPPGLEARIREAVRRDRALAVETGDETAGMSVPQRAGGSSAVRWAVPRWALAAAAVLVLALGTLEVVERRDAAPGDSGLERVALEDAPSPWASDDAIVAGAPVFDELSDEALASLLEELGG